MQYIELVAVRPQKFDSKASHADRRRKIIVGPVVSLNNFQKLLEEKTGAKPSDKRDQSLVDKYEVNFTLRPGPQKPAKNKVVSPTEALSLNWIPSEWLTKNQTATIQEVEPSNEESSVSEPALANATA